MFQLCGGTFHHLILGTYLLHGGHPVRRDAHADCAAADPGPDVARLERRLHRPLELRGRVDGGHPDDEAEGGRQRHRHHSFPDLIGSLKLGNVRVFVQPIFGPRWPVNQLYKTQTLPNLRLPISYVQNKKNAVTDSAKKAIMHFTKVLAARPSQ